MLNNGAIIDEIYLRLMKLSESQDYNFNMLRGDWGRANSTGYNDKKNLFCKSMRQLAKASPVKYIGGAYYVFNGRIYEIVEVGVIEAAYEMVVESLCISPMIAKPTVRKTCFLDVIKYYNVLSPRLDLAAFSNGVLDLSDPFKPVLHDFSPEFHVLHYHPYEYNPDADCYRWSTFLKEVLPDKNQRMVLQMFLGLGFVQRGVAWDPYKYKSLDKVELCLMMIGAGANGKSVIFEVIRELFGRERISSMDYDTLTADGDEGMRGRYPIRNAIFNWSTDSNARKFGKKNTGMFKRLVSGEPVPYRKLGEDVMESGRLPYLIFSLNELPYPEDASLGFIRRLQFVSFDVVIPKEKQNPDLANILIKNELPGIFNWVLRGTNELRRRRFKFPLTEGSRKAVLRTLLGANPILAWLKAYSIRNEKNDAHEFPVYISAQDMYESFVMFCKDNEVEEREIPTPQKFGRTMWDKCSFFKKRTSAGVSYETYGVTENSLKKTIYITSDEDLEKDSVHVAGKSFIKDDD